jgi:phenylalanyl-tRNA synthetase beta chain
MKIPLKWLADYVTLDMPVAELAERLTRAGLEVSGVRLIGMPPPEGLRLKAEEAGPVWDRDKIVIAEILKVDTHPKADRLKLPVVAYGQGRTKTLVTGAPNINVGDQGQKVILALTGSVLYDGHATPKVLRELKPTKIRDMPSDAMVCSAFELGISDEHEGIILLEDDAPVGTPLVDYMGDIVLELDVTPNLARCLSLLGVAREVAALSGQCVKLPPHQAQAEGPPIEGQVRVSIEDPDLSARYAAVLLKDVRIGPSPGWMQRRLSYAGMRPINNVVDVTNYVLLEWGQPLHAFDYDKLLARAGGKAPHIIVRPARAGETLTTLDEGNQATPLKLTPDMLVIADEKGPVALAGIKGGADTRVTEATRNILLESANFDFLVIRRTMRALNLPSEASVRFSKGIHPEQVRRAAERAAELMRQLAGATVCRGIVDVYPRPLPPQVIDLKLSEVRRLLGMDMPRQECTRILEALEFRVEPAGADALRVTVPPHRLDIQEGPADLIEDLIRLHGYDRLPATLIEDRLPPQLGNPELDFEERVRDRLVSAGLQEVITYSLTTPEREAPFGLPENDYVRLANPISSDRVVMRHSVLASVLEVAANNLKHEGDVRLFEIGSVYLPRPGQKLPDEPRRLALVMTGRRQPEHWQDSKESGTLDFFDLKGIVEGLLEDLHVAKVTYRPVRAPALHPGKGAEVRAGDKVLGQLGQLHPRLPGAIQGAGSTFRTLEGRTVLVAELDLEALRGVVPDRHLYTPVSPFPPALRDVAMIVDEGLPAEKVATEIREGGKPLLRGLRLFDVYQGDPIPAGRKNLAYALTYQADDRTLTDKEVNDAHKKIEKRLVHVLKAEIRAPKKE